MLTYIWLIPLLPFLGFVVNGFGGLLKLRLTGTRLSKPFVYWVGCGSVFLAFLLSIGCFIELLQRDAHHRIVEVTVFEWIPGLAFQTVTAGLVKLTVSWGMQLDPLSAVMILVVTGVGFLIHVYSIGYMYEESGFYRFFAYLNLFMFMMLTLVLANNYLLMFVGWEGVGLCSYLLIGYYTEKKSAGDAAKKAFVVNRIGDFGFLHRHDVPVHLVRDPRFHGGLREGRRVFARTGGHLGRPQLDRHPLVCRSDRKERPGSALRLAA